MNKNHLFKFSMFCTTLLPVMTIISCDNGSKASGKQSKTPETKGIAASYINHADILLGMGIIPQKLMIKGLEANLDYLEPYAKKITISDYINTFGTLDPIKMQSLAKDIAIILTSFGEEKLAKFFDSDKILRTVTSPSYEGDKKETITWTLSSASGKINTYGTDVEYVGSRALNTVDIYYNWLKIAKEMDGLISQKDEDKSNDHQFEQNTQKVIATTKKRISALKAEVDKLTAKKMVIYSWGEKTSPTAGAPNTDLSDKTWYQYVQHLQSPLGTLIYSKKYGLGFDAPSFDSNKKVVITKTGYPTITGLENGPTEVREALKAQNDYVLFTKQLYKSDNLKFEDVKNAFGEFLKDNSKADTNLWWFKDGLIDSMSYGPLGINAIIDFVSKKLNVTLNDKLDLASINPVMYTTE